MLLVVVSALNIGYAHARVVCCDWFVCMLCDVGSGSVLYVVLGLKLEFHFALFQFPDSSVSPLVDAPTISWRALRVSFRLMVLMAVEQFSDIESLAGKVGKHISQLRLHGPCMSAH